jgi:DNA-binding CsgD family transcriptional regulator
MNADEEVLHIVSREADGTTELSNGSVLVARELEVLTLMAHGKSNREIAEELFLSVHTIEYHATRIYEKLGVTNRTQAARVAADIGLPDADQSISAAADAMAQAQSAAAEKLSRGIGRWAVRLALGALSVAFLAVLLIGALGFALSTSSSAQHCVGMAIATPYPPGSPPPAAVPDERPDSICFDTQEEAWEYLGIDPESLQPAFPR